MNEDEADRWIIKNLDNLEKLYKEVSGADILPFDALCFFACSDKIRLSCRRQGKGNAINKFAVTDIKGIKYAMGSVEPLRDPTIDVCFKTTYVHEAIKKSIKTKKKGGKFEYQKCLQDL